MTARRCTLIALVSGLLVAPGRAADDARQPEQAPAWAEAHLEGPLSADETRQFMKELARYVFDNHLKKDPDSPQRGMVYEYLDTRRKGQFDQFVQGEGLDTMHDGAWLAAATVNAHRATGDPFYREFLTEWQLPFYLEMLNHSDELFTWEGAVAREGATPWDKPWAYQEGEKGFVPYFWDDGGSVSIERRYAKNPLGIRPCVDRFATAGKPNPRFLLDGYSLGMSNHMAQDLGVMLQLAWLLLRQSDDPAERKLAGEVAEAARNLHECRVRHFGPIPMCVAPAALATGDAELMRRVPKPDDERYWTPSNHYVRFLVGFEPGKQLSLPGFADDQQYHYYYGIARSGGTMPRPLAFKVVYDAYTEPQLYRYYSDDAPVPAGINRFDLHPITGRDGKLDDYRSDRRGPYGGPKPIGSRFGPQNMVCCGWALQILDAMPGTWEEPYEREFSKEARVLIEDYSAGPPRVRQIMLLPFDGGAVELSSTRLALRMSIVLPQKSVQVKVFDHADAKGNEVSISIDGDKVSVLNAKQDELISHAEVSHTRGVRTVRVTIPYTIAKSQKPWMNAIEHGRRSIAVGDEVQNFYLAGQEKHVKAWLEHELGAGLRTWQAVFREYGCIPTGIGTGSRWHGISDSGGYAHLISACAEWLLYLDGKRDWELHRVPKL